MGIEFDLKEVRRYSPASIIRRMVGERLDAIYVYNIISIAVLVLIWHTIATTTDIILAPPVEAINSWFELMLSGTLPLALLDSFKHMTLGYVIGVSLAIPLGVLMGQSKIVRWAFNPYVDALYATPAIAYVPLIIVWFGLRFEARVFLVFTFCFFEVLINTYEGVSSIDDAYFDVGRSFGLSWWGRQRKVLLPASLPYIFAGLRLGIGRAVRGMIVAELFLAVVNLGRLLETAASQFDTANQLAIIATITLVGLIGQVGMERLEERVLPWRHVKQAEGN